jgi:hypothetical protein
MLLKKFDFIRNSNVYIKEGYLEKYKCESNENIHKILNRKFKEGLELTEEEIEFIVSNFEGVVIENCNNLQFVSYTGNMYLRL